MSDYQVVMLLISTMFITVAITSAIYMSMLHKQQDQYDLLASTLDGVVDEKCEALDGWQHAEQYLGYTEEELRRVMSIPGVKALVTRAEERADYQLHG